MKHETKQKTLVKRLCDRGNRHHVFHIGQFPFSVFFFMYYMHGFQPTAHILGQPSRYSMAQEGDTSQTQWVLVFAQSCHQSQSSHWLPTASRLWFLSMLIVCATN